MAGQYYAPDSSDLQVIYVDDYALIDQQANTGSLWGWGSNDYGELGIGIIGTGNSSPVQVSGGGTNWKQVASGYAHTTAIKTDGTLWSWGYNAQGQLGLNNIVYKSTPVQVTMGGVANTNWKQVSCGGLHTTAIKTDGTLWSWGGNVYGQLGIGISGIGNSTPIQVTGGGTNWKQVSGGYYHTAAIKTDGTLWTWGYNFYGQLGIGSVAYKSTPVQVTMGGVANTNWKQVSGGNYHTAAIKTDGTLWTWGPNNQGQLGDNTTVNKSTPVQVTMGGVANTNWKQVAAFDHTTAIKTDGTLWSWGYNAQGELGDNTIVNKSSPVQVTGGGTNWKQVTCGNYHTAAIKTDGTLWTWGYNAQGQLGDNTLVAKSSPIQTISGGTNWKQVSTGHTTLAAIYFYDAGNLYPSA